MKRRPAARQRSISEHPKLDRPVGQRTQNQVGRNAHGGKNETRDQQVGTQYEGNRVADVVGIQIGDPLQRRRHLADLISVAIFSANRKKTKTHPPDQRKEKLCDYQHGSCHPQLSQPRCGRRQRRRELLDPLAAMSRRLITLLGQCCVRREATLQEP
jgi:hypothetical protein